MRNRLYYTMYRHPVLVVLVVFFIAACGTEPPTGTGNPVPEAVATVEVVPALDTLVATGETAELRVTLLDANGAVLSGREVTWRSSDEAIADVSGNAEGATVNALAPGTVTITAESEGRNAALEMRVISADLVAAQALLEDPYTVVVVDALSGTNASELRATMTGMRDDVVGRFLSGVRDRVGDAAALITTDASAEDVVMHAVIRLLLDHIESFLDF